MKTGNLRYAVLGLVSRRPDGIHGYRLKSDLEALCDDFWQLNYGRMYRVLDKLENDGQLAASDQIQERRPNRKIYRITETGRQNLEDWLEIPVSADPRPLRDELALKLLFLDENNPEAFYEQIRAQRGIYLNRLGQVGRRRTRLTKAGLDSRTVTMVMDGAEMRVEADIAWLEHLERKILRTMPQKS